MGGGGSTEYITPTVYVYADPNLLKSLTDMQQKTAQLNQSIGLLEKEIINAEKQAKMKNDPRLYQKYREESFNKFIDKLGQMSFTKPIQKSSKDQRHHILIGAISSGKSSLLNNFFGLKQPISSGQCTKKPKIVTKIGNVTIWDSPGINEEFKVYDRDILSFFHCADKIFILYCNSLKCIPQLVKILAKIKPKNTILIRTQTDTWNKSMKKTIKDQIQTDKSILKNWGIDLPVYATSAKREIDFEDNQLVYNLMSLI